MEIFNNIRLQQTQQTQQTQSGQQSHIQHQEVQSGKNEMRQSAPTKPSDRIEMEEIDAKGEKERIKQKLQELTEQLNEEMNPLKTSIRFGFNDKIEELYISVIDTSKNKEIRKIPSDEAMRLAAKMRELVGMLFDKKG